MTKYKSILDFTGDNMAQSKSVTVAASFQHVCLNVGVAILIVI